MSTPTQSIHCIKWDEFTKSAKQSSKKWATSDRGWFHVDGLCRGFYLDYGPNQYRSPHKYERHPCDCFECMPGMILACAYDRESEYSGPSNNRWQYVETVSQAKQWIEREIMPSVKPTKTKSPFQKGQVALAMRDGGMTVDALLKDGLAIHKAPCLSRSYTITHVQSGQAVFGTYKQSAAKQAVIELTSLDIDWEDDAQTLTSLFSRNKEITNLIKMCQAKYRYL